MSDSRKSSKQFYRIKEYPFLPSIITFQNLQDLFLYLYSLSKRIIYDIIEVKYYSNELSLGEMNKEAAQIRAIPGVKIREIGFISAKGFASKSEYKLCLTAEDLYYCPTGS